MLFKYLYYGATQGNTNTYWLDRDSRKLEGMDMRPQ